MTKNKMEFLNAEIEATEAKIAALMLTFEQWQIDTHSKLFIGPAAFSAGITGGTELLRMGKTPALELERQIKMLDGAFYIVNKFAQEAATQLVEDAMKIASQHTLEEIEEMCPKIPKRPESAPKSAAESVARRRRAANGRAPNGGLGY